MACIKKYRRRLPVCCEHCGAMDSFVDIVEADRAGWTVNRVGLINVDECWTCPKCFKQMIKSHETNEDYLNRTNSW